MLVSNWQKPYFDVPGLEKLSPLASASICSEALSTKAILSMTDNNSSTTTDLEAILVSEVQLHQLPKPVGGVLRRLLELSFARSRHLLSAFLHSQSPSKDESIFCARSSKLLMIMITAEWQHKWHMAPSLDAGACSRVVLSISLSNLCVLPSLLDAATAPAGMPAASLRVRAEGQRKQNCLLKNPIRKRLKF